MSNHEFIKIGERIVAKPKGSDYNLVPGKVYDLGWDGYTCEIIFKENGELNLPKKVYQTSEDEKFKKRIITYFNKSNSNTTGVLLAGTKGTGKTVMAKVIATESNLPIIVVSPSFPETKLLKFFKSFTTPVCILLDEVEKNFDTKKMLDFLDGIEKTTQKLVLMTCNNLSKVSEYMQDRCSRVRYLRQYSAEDNISFLPLLAEDFEIKNPEEVIEFCKNNINLLSMDNITSFLYEVKLLEDEDISLSEIIKVMNITTKNIKSKPEIDSTKEFEPKELEELSACFGEDMNTYISDDE